MSWNTPLPPPQLLEGAGSEGRHQRLLLLLFLLPTNFVMPWMALAPILMASTPDHWCAVPGRPQGVSSLQWRSATIPRSDRVGQLLVYSQ